MEDSIEAFIFDLDGTLLDSLAGIANSANQLVGAAGFQGHPVDAYRDFIGEGVEMLFRNALRGQTDDLPTIQDCAEKFPSVYGDSWKAGTTIYDGIVELLNHLTASHVPFGVLSNKPHSNTVVCVQELLGDWPFAAVFGQRPEVPRKPDPAAALEISRIMSKSPEQIAFVGDSTADMMTGINAGMLSVGVSWGFGTKQILNDAGAGTIVDKPAELLRLL